MCDPPGKQWGLSMGGNVLCHAFRGKIEIQSVKLWRLLIGVRGLYSCVGHVTGPMNLADILADDKFSFTNELRFKIYPLPTTTSNSNCTPFRQQCPFKAYLAGVWMHCANTSSTILSLQTGHVTDETHRGFQLKMFYSD